MKEGKIINVIGSAGSGIAFLIIQEPKKEFPTRVPCDNGPLIRLLDDMFPGFITPGHSFDPAKVRGQPIKFLTDDLGLLMALEEG